MVLPGLNERALLEHLQRQWIFLRQAEGRGSEGITFFLDGMA